MERLARLASFTKLRLLAAYLMRGLGWLRTLALTGVACLALYFYSLPQPLIAVVYWNMFYMLRNAGWIDWLMRRWRAAQA